MISKGVLKELLFPYDTIRESQNELIIAIDSAIKEKRNLVVHAPTGLGKTAASLGPALAYAINNGKTVFFLTSRHTQHKIAIDTLKAIKEKYALNFDVVDILGRKAMCPIPGVEKLFSGEFSEYCKNVREDDKCEFFTNTKSKSMTVKSKGVLSQIKELMPIHAERLYEICVENRLCPYEVSMMFAKKAKVIVGDYYYLFNPKIKDTFFKKTEKLIEDSILIVDEGHNLPNRVKDLATERITNIMLKRAISEAKKFQLDSLSDSISMINDILLSYSKELKHPEKENIIAKENFIKKIKEFEDYENLISQLELAAIRIREEQKQSYIGSISSFLEAWKGGEEGFVRIFSVKDLRREEILMLSYRCLDPSIMTSDVINSSHSTIVMSGTLTPTSMYTELLGIKNCDEEVFGSPFPKENKINMIVPGVSTKFTQRNDAEYKKIAEICAKITNAIPGNTAIFFPSYYILSLISKDFDTLTEKTVFKESSGLLKQEKEELLERFKEYKNSGAVLLGVISGSFGEGIDLPGDFLKCVVIVGLPFSQPDLETRSLIDYYDQKFKKGWEYGYVAPAFNKTFQCAGRCIRSETDKGIVVFVDERYKWGNYFKYFPKDWNMKITAAPEEKIKEFYENNH